MIDLSVQLGPLKLKNPVLVASGTFGYARECEGLVNFDALGGIVTKSISPKPRPGNPPTRIAELPAGMLNSIGLANVGVEAFVSEKLPFLRSLNTTIIVNIAGSTAEEFLAVIQRLEREDGIDAYELNYSCPNVKEGGLEFSQKATVTHNVTRKLRTQTKRPLIAKLTPNVTKVSDIAIAAKEGGADAVSLINSLVGLAIDVNSRRPQVATVTGGYTGPAIKPIALAKVYEVAKHVDIPIIGIGGIMNGNDALEFLIAGAHAIQVGTANFINPATGEKIVHALRQYCERHELQSISDVSGTLKT